MATPYLIGLVGARGFVGREILRLIAGHPEAMLAYAVSRELAGRPVTDIAPEARDGCVFEALAPQAAARRRADLVILAAPDGASAAYVEAIEEAAADRAIIDLSADHRFDERWAYGLPELNRSAIEGARRIANPGCYATALQLALAPLLKRVEGAPSVFGVSGFSGAGSTPSPRNDEKRLADNLAPYGLVEHKHEREAARHLGMALSFTPSVHPAFRGLVTIAHVALRERLDKPALRALFDDFYAGEPMIALRDEPPELKTDAFRSGATIGGFAVSDNGRRATIVASIDNLLKGAATQAIQNLNLSLGLEETLGIAETGAP